jgi:outer membrane protein
MKRLSLVLLSMAVLLTAFGQQRNEFAVRLRGVALVPQVSGTLSLIGGDLKVSEAYMPELDLSWFFANNFSAELTIATTRHHVTIRNADLSAFEGPASANIDAGKVRVFSPMLTVQYHFPTMSSFKPYAGLGATYAIFYDQEKSSVVDNVQYPLNDISYKNRFGFATQVGMDYNINKRWFFNIDIKKIFLPTTVTVDASNLVTLLDLHTSVDLSNVKSNLKLDPWVFGLGIGFRF